VQLVEQAPPVQTKGAQLCVGGTGGLQVPLEQIGAFVSTVPEQLALPHTVPLGHCEQAPEPSHPPESPQLDVGAIGHCPCGSRPPLTAPQTPSAPCPFAAAEQAWQVPVQPVLQHTPSTQNPLVQSPPAPHFLPFAQRVAHVVGLPPQSTSVSFPSCFASLQASMPTQPSGNGPPHVLPSATHVVGVQPQRFAVPPPPHVFGSVQSALVWQPHCPVALHTSPGVVPQVAPAWYAGTAAPALLHVYVRHFGCGDGGTFVTSTTLMVPPIPSHTSFWQFPGTCGGFCAVAMPIGVFTVVQVLVLEHAGCWQSVVVPGQSASDTHSTQWPSMSQ
jgi:hypothetical protein